MSEYARGVAVGFTIASALVGSVFLGAVVIMRYRVTIVSWLERMEDDTEPPVDDWAEEMEDEA